MKPDASWVILACSAVYLSLTARFWHIAWRRRILREVLNHFHYEALVDLLLFVLFGGQVYLLMKYYAGVEGRFDWAYCFASFGLFVWLALKKMDRVCISGKAYAKNAAAEFDTVMDGIEIRKRFREYMNERGAK